MVNILNYHILVNLDQMINYRLLQDSIDYYENHGFKRIETPWLVSEYANNITKPIDGVNFQLKDNDKCLVASGEQSFLYLYLKEQLPKGQFQTITPCYRPDNIDFLHNTQFVKNELIKTDIVTENELKKIVDICFTFYKKMLPDVNIVKTLTGYDIELYNIELGSYGIGNCEFLSWIYATGCAEPRTSKLIEKYGKR